MWRPRGWAGQIQLCASMSGCAITNLATWLLCWRGQVSITLKKKDLMAMLGHRQRLDLATLQEKKYMWRQLKKKWLEAKFWDGVFLFWIWVVLMIRQFKLSCDRKLFELNLSRLMIGRPWLEPGNRWRPPMKEGRGGVFCFILFYFGIKSGFSL